jgi:hypothetical protein
MQVTFSERELNTVLAALVAWQNPIQFMTNGLGKELFKKQAELAPEQLEYLIRRLRTTLGLPAGNRLAPHALKS